MKWLKNLFASGGVVEGPMLRENEIPVVVTRSYSLYDEPAFRPYPFPFKGECGDHWIIVQDFDWGPVVVESKAGVETTTFDLAPHEASDAMKRALELNRRAFELECHAKHLAQMLSYPEKALF